MRAAQDGKFRCIRIVLSCRDALPRGPLQGFRQNIPTNRQGGLSCSSSSDTKRYRRLRCGKRARTTDCGSSCEHCGVVFWEGKRVCPQCDALPRDAALCRGAPSGFRQNILPPCAARCRVSKYHSYAAAVRLPFCIPEKFAFKLIDFQSMTVI